MVQEVLNEHKLPPEFSRDVWNLCMDWLCSVDETSIEEKKEQAERIVLATTRDPDVAIVNQWRQQAEPIPDWALAIDKETPRYGFEICNHGWIKQLERSVWMIGNETPLPNPPPGECGTVPASQRQWAALADDTLSRWLADTPVSTEDAPFVKKIHGLLGPVDDEKSGAVRLLQNTLRLAMLHRPGDFDAVFTELKADSDLAEEMRGAIKYLQFTCGYRWEKIVLELCRAIGDSDYRASKPLAWHVGSCNGQISFVYRDDPLRVPTTCAILVGIWAWLKDISSDVVESTYPTLSPLAAHVRNDLGQMTLVKRWLAGRLFVGIRIWLQEIDHGDIKPPKPAMEVYPALDN